jgi:hypothetical protein
MPATIRSHGLFGATERVKQAFGPELRYWRHRCSSVFRMIAEGFRAGHGAQIFSWRPGGANCLKSPRLKV